mgnify:CR=1 FL=1
MNNHDFFDQWLKLIRRSYSSIKNEITVLYKLKTLLDDELSMLFVEKVSIFYKELFNLYDGYSLEAPEPMEYLIEEFSRDLEKFIESYSELLYFKEVLKDLTGQDVDYPKVIRDVWHEIKDKYLRDFIEIKYQHFLEKESYQEFVETVAKELVNYAGNKGTDLHLLDIHLSMIVKDIRYKVQLKED